MVTDILSLLKIFSYLSTFVKALPAGYLDNCKNVLDKPALFSYNDYNNDKRSDGDDVPSPSFQRAAGWCKAVLGFGQLAPEQPAEKEFIRSRTGRDSPVTGIGIRRLYAADAESGRAVYLPPMGMVPRKSSAFVSFIRTMVAEWKRGLFLLLHNTLPGACQKNVYIHSIY